MAQRLSIPKFSSEREEAEWWFTHQDEVDDELELADREGRLGSGTAVRRVLAQAELMHLLSEEDLQLAHRLAARRGQNYVDVVKAVLHDALLQEAARA